MKNSLTIVNKISKITCSSCGSSDVTIGKKEYTCNYCNSKYLLPPEFIEKTVTTDEISNQKRPYVIVFGAFLVIFVLLLLIYIKLDKKEIPKETDIEKRVTKIQKSPIPSIKKIEKPKLFKNIIFDNKTFSTIHAFKATKRGTYLVAGTFLNNIVRIIELDKYGKQIWNRTFTSGYYISLAETKDGGTILSYHLSNKGATVKLDDKGKIVFKLERYFDSIVADGNSFVGVLNGTVSKIDENSREVFHTIINHEKSIRKAGLRRDIDGKLKSYKKTFSKMQLKFLTRLKNGNFVAVGEFDKFLTSVIIIDPKGSIVKKKRFDFERIFIDDLSATSDGGFIILARKGMRVFKFDQNAELTKRENLADGFHKIYNHQIKETKDGYIITATLSQKKDAEVFITLTDKDFKNITRKSFTKEGLRLHPKAMTKAFDGGYLLAINSEIYESFIVRVQNDGTIDANPNDPTKPAKAKIKAVKIKAGQYKAFRTHTQFQENRESKNQTITTTPFYGGSIKEMVISKDRKYLYTLSGATGFKIIQLSDKPKLLSNLLRTKSELVVKPHYIAPIDGKPPTKGTAYNYDSPSHIEVDEKNNIAYISDTTHGFYAVDIKDKNHPKLRYALRDLKAYTFTLSKDKKEIYFYKDAKFYSFNLKSFPKDAKNFSYFGGNVSSLKLSKNGRWLLISDQKMLIIYDILAKKESMRYETSSSGYIEDIILKDEKIYLSVQFKGVDILEFDQRDGSLKPIAPMEINTYFSHVKVVDNNKICFAKKRGVSCYDIKDPLNPKPWITIKNEEGTSASSLVNDTKNKQLIIAYTIPSIGYFNYK